MKGKSNIKTPEELSNDPKYWRNLEGEQFLTKDQWLDDLRKWFVEYNKKLRLEYTNG